MIMLHMGMDSRDLHTLDSHVSPRYRAGTRFEELESLFVTGRDFNICRIWATDFGSAARESAGGQPDCHKRDSFQCPSLSLRGH